MKLEVSSMIQQATKGYYGLEKVLKSKVLSKNLKINDTIKTNYSIRLGNMGVEKNRRIGTIDFEKESRYYRKFTSQSSINKLMNGEN